MMASSTPWRLPRHCDVDVFRYLSLRFGPGWPHVYASSRVRRQDIRVIGQGAPFTSSLAVWIWQRYSVWDDQDWEMLRIRIYKRMSCRFRLAQLLHSNRPLFYLWYVRNQLLLVFRLEWCQHCDNALPTFMPRGKLFIEKLNDVYFVLTNVHRKMRYNSVERGMPTVLSSHIWMYSFKLRFWGVSAGTIQKKLNSWIWAGLWSGFDPMSNIDSGLARDSLGTIFDQLYLIANNIGVPFSANTNTVDCTLTDPDNHKQHATISQGSQPHPAHYAVKKFFFHYFRQRIFSFISGYIVRSLLWAGVLCELISQLHIPSNPSVILLNLKQGLSWNASWSAGEYACSRTSF